MIELILFCLGTASLTHFFWVSMNEGMIFHGWYKFIEKAQEKEPCFYKILGGCIYCTGSWIFLMLYPWVMSWEGLLNIILGLGFNYVFIKVIERI